MSQHGSFGCQFHAGLLATDVRQLIDSHSDLITKYGGDPAAAHRSVDRYAGAPCPRICSATW